MWLVIAVLLVLVGSFMFVFGIPEAEWDFSMLSTEVYTTNSYEAREELDRISINVDTTEIEFLPTDEDVCVVVCYEMNKS